MRLGDDGESADSLDSLQTIGFGSAETVALVGSLVWGLRQTAREEGRNYSQQIVAGTMMAVIAGVVIVVASLAFIAVFPDAMDAPRAADPSATPMSQALSGFIGTLITGILASAVIAIVVRGPRR